MSSLGKGEVMVMSKAKHATQTAVVIIESKTKQVDCSAVSPATKESTAEGALAVIKVLVANFTPPGYTTND